MQRDKKSTKEKIDRSIETNLPENPREHKESQEQKIKDKYTDKEGNPADHIREENPNRNVDKTDATNAGGYKN